MTDETRYVLGNKRLMAQIAESLQTHQARVGRLDSEAVTKLALNAQDWQAFVSALENPPEPTEGPMESMGGIPPGWASMM